MLYSVCVVEMSMCIFLTPTDSFCFNLFLTTGKMCKLVLALTAHEHIQQPLSPHNTHRGYTTCLSAGRPFSMEAPTKPPLSLAPGWHKGPRSGVTWKAGAPNTLFSCFFSTLSPSHPLIGISCCPTSPSPVLPLLYILSLHPSSLFFAGLLGPLSERPLPLRHPLLVPP